MCSQIQNQSIPMACLRRGAGLAVDQWICPLTTIPSGDIPAAKGDPGMGVSAPLTALIVNPETVLSLKLEFVT